MGQEVLVMFVAIDENNNRIFASVNADGKKKYYCPVCQGEVRLRSYKEENLNVPHFAHINSCTDDFSTDMSEWHRAWQELFPKGNREVVVTHGEEKHRADVLCYGTVIEFQHSPISEHEFWRRNNFYTSAGYKVVWIFDVRELFDAYDSSGRMYITGEWDNNFDFGEAYKWKHPWRFLREFIPQDEKDISIFFQIVEFGENPKEHEICYMEKVVWINTFYKPRWGLFRTSLNNNPADYLELLHWLKKRWEKEKIKDNEVVSVGWGGNYRRNNKVDGVVVESADFDAFVKSNQPLRRLVSDAFSWKRKYPYPREEQFCPRDKKAYRNFSSGNCYGCAYCLAIEEVDENKQYVYCKHPHRVSSDNFPDVFYRVNK